MEKISSSERPCSYYYCLLFEHLIGSHIMYKLQYFGGKTTRKIWEGWKTSELGLHVYPVEYYCRTIFFSPFILPHVFPDVGPWSFPKPVCCHKKFNFPSVLEKIVSSITMLPSEFYFHYILLEVFFPKNKVREICGICLN